MQTLHTILIIVIPILHNQLGNSEFSGETQGCSLDSGRTGTCVHIRNCPEAIEQINDGGVPKNCDDFPIVCCETTSIARQKCNGYKEDSYSIPLIGIGGVDASHLEFPHMAILGYGNVDNVTWQCGGSLISETFVLTAAHCINTRLGRVQHVKLGVHLLNTTNEREQSFNVEKVYTYPEYVRGRAYHDVALIRLDHAANIQDGVEPACLHTERELPKRTLTATGWGAVKLYGGIHNTLQKFTLHHVPVGNCSSYYRNQRTLNIGVIDDWQICADGGEEIVDTCQGDSGGPLQFKARYFFNVYVIVGIVSTGLKCAVVPGIYTRVSHYVPWIESIVWPNE